ncbi:MAG: transporter substrate-binding domain-containing protein, partial [Burkholderiaceae bacterium]
MSAFTEKLVWVCRGATCCALLLSAGFSHAGTTIDRIRSTQTITIAYREASVPFSFLEADGKPVGYAIDLCLRIADAVKRELKLPAAKTAFVPVTPANRIAMIRDGKADLECGSTTNNAERRQQVAFTIPHFVAAARMLVRADSGIR